MVQVDLTGAALTDIARKYRGYGKFKELFPNITREHYALVNSGHAVFKVNNGQATIQMVDKYEQMYQKKSKK